MSESTISKLKPLENEFTDLRRHLHQNPEVGFDLPVTSALVAKKLKEWGYEVHTGLAQSGVVGTLKKGTGTKIIGLRADMDALPVQEASGKDWSSKTACKHHGCGHDGHTATLLMAAKYLAQNQHFDGTLRVIFQPAEELLYGGQVMVNDGLFKLFPCDAIFGIHNMPGYDLGSFYSRPGGLMASSDTLHIHITGKGSHGAQPENGIDAGIVACYIATALQTIVSRNTSPQDAAVITIGCIQAGEAANVVNEKALMKLSIRALSENVRAKLLQRIEEVATLQAKSFGATAVVEKVSGCPALVSHAEAADFANDVARKVVGNDKVHTDVHPLMGSEDFAYLLEAQPYGAYLFLGAGKSDSEIKIHNPAFDFNDACLIIGAAFWVQLTEDYLK